MSAEPTVPYSEHQAVIDDYAASACACGCGARTPISKTTGEPLPFINGHWNKVGRPEYKVDPDTGCWLWQRPLGTYGYGLVRYEGKQIEAHRAYYRKFVGPIPEGMTVDHLCRVRHCVNPAHLECVTNAENCRRGANAKVTAEDAKAIRESGLSRTALARQYGVGYSAIAKIQRGERWA